MFPGFPPNPARRVGLPDVFFTDVLPHIEHLGELKVLLYIFWHISQQEGDIRFVKFSSIASDELFMRGLAPSTSTALQNLESSLERCRLHQWVLAVEMFEKEQRVDVLYFLNSPRGQAAVDALVAGQWKPDDISQWTTGLADQRPNIFQLYETHIGPLTPMLADTLKDAEDTYPAAWIEEAIQIAVERNARNWRYVEGILRRWQEKGRDERKTGTSAEESQLEYFNQLAAKLEKRRK